MSDAKSRYEIVESLTNQKQTVINSINELDRSAEAKELELEQLRVDTQRGIEDGERELKSFIDSIDSRRKGLEKKESAYTEAIEALKAISSQANTA